MKKKWLFIGAALAALLQTGFLYASIETRASILRSGREVVLQTHPVDPRDLMRGDYVILGYDISSVDIKEIKGQPQAGDKRTVYVALKPGTDEKWHFSRASFNPFTDLDAEEVQLRGESRYVISPHADHSVPVAYGIERYYVPEGEGRAIEEGQQEKRITVVLAVNANGTAVIKALRDNGRQLHKEPLY
ncbi:GDYXXLXY domain-containing protein [Brucella sp. BE17]|uniref:GDYXXLXY domain-containing protein n=1 Tax=Brucella sp. BE17 TaxID=3142977 RepID=UPI0031BAA495